MSNSSWDEAIAVCADPARARHYLDLLLSTSAAADLGKVGPEQARITTALLSGSKASSELLIVHPEWLAQVMDVEELRNARQAPGIRREIAAWLDPLLDQRQYESAYARLRMFKQMALVRIATRDLCGFGAVVEITGELSDVAEVCLETVYTICRRQLADRFGEPWHLDSEGKWRRTSFCVLGLGKLGGRELNYSSDVDVLFVYTEEGHVFKEPPSESQQQGPKVMPSHQFFKRLAENFVAEVGRLTREGMLYRIDLRLRPEGNAGPLARSIESYETYYAQWGQTWERMMLIKARRAAGDAELASEFIEMIQPFRYPRSLSETALRDIAAMKERIENEVVRAGEIDRNVKLGRGGIREIEFLVQTLQLLHVGRQPFLADSQTLSSLEKLVRYGIMDAPLASALSAAYEFLRNVEHRLQMENDLQTHTIPADRKERARLAALMGCQNLRTFTGKLNQHRRCVRKAYESLLKFDDAQVRDALPADFDECETEWKDLLGAHSFRDPDKAFRLAGAFIEGPGFGHTSSRTKGLARALFGRLLALCPRKDQPVADDVGELQDGDPASRRLSDPDRVLARLDSFIAAYGARSLLFETWDANPSLFKLLVLLFDRSEFLAEVAIRTPDLVDELELSGHLRRTKTPGSILDDLRRGQDEKDQRLWVRRYHQAEVMRIGLRDILGLADFEQSLVELSALAEACLRHALEVVMRRHQLASPPFAIVGLGKLGGYEIDYGSDLDVVFVAGDKTRNLPKLQRVAAELIDLLSGQTELGAAFHVDTRLRPDGDKGLLVNTLRAYHEYYRHRARLWELQALSRARPIAGSQDVLDRFRHMVAVLADFSKPGSVAARFPDWREEIARMRLRIEKERTQPGKDILAIKTGVGGLVDAEFVAQTLCMANGWFEPNTLRALCLARDNGALPAEAASLLIDNYRKLRRFEGILRRWSYVGETTLPDDPAPMYRVAVRCGFRNAEAFLQAVERYRAGLRRVYQQVFSSVGGSPIGRCEKACTRVPRACSIWGET